MEAMVGALDPLELGDRSESGTHAGHQPKIRQFVPGSLEKQHGDRYGCQVVRSFLGRWLAYPVEWESDEGQPSHVGEGRLGCGQRRHPPAHRFASGDERYSGARCARGRDHRAGLEQHERASCVPGSALRLAVVHLWPPVSLRTSRSGFVAGAAA